MFMSIKSFTVNPAKQYLFLIPLTGVQP